MPQTIQALPDLRPKEADPPPPNTGVMEGDCILWTGAGSKSSNKKKKPCGIIRRRDKWRKNIIGKTPAKHFWEIHHDRPVPDGMSVGHVCPNSLCINVKHLIMGTNSAISIMFGAQGRLKRVPKTHCKAGHPLEGENLFLADKPNGAVDRSCRICRNKIARELARKKFGFKPRPKHEHPDMHETTFQVTDKAIMEYFETNSVMRRRRYEKLNERFVRLLALYAIKYYTLTEHTKPMKKESAIIKARLLKRKKCFKGLHFFTKENTLVYWNKTDGRWGRMCRACANKRFRTDQRRRHGFGTIKKYKKELLEG